ncbi:hypothetical protein HDU82_000013 [Entophlyctis luteolus]|nr:hypothetical protein HDU82_000013 [Entophlyctis luteolus]
MSAAVNATANPVVSADVSWLLVSSALVFFMVPGLGFFYSGLAEAKNAMTMLQAMMFAAITPALFVGATAGRMKLLPTAILAFLWTTIVYDPVAYWVWSANGWLHGLNVMDYAGGSVIHVSSGVAALVLAFRLDRRSDYGCRSYDNHSPTFVYLGTAILWFGWMGFNGGSALASNERAINAAFASNLAACMGGLVWLLLEITFNGKRFTSIGFCTGAIAGLATITPGSGFVQPGFGLVYGAAASVAGFFSIKFMHWAKIDDSLDVMAVHGVGGALGMVLTGIFAQYSVTTTDVASGATAGWVDHVWIQVPVQLAAIFAIAAWSAVWTAVLVFFIDTVLGIKMRCSRDDEYVGLDVADIGEQAYPSSSSASHFNPAAAEAAGFNLFNVGSTVELIPKSSSHGSPSISV